jgi:2-octaprenyl-6-methoxyphenol hydroxylase
MSAAERAPVAVLGGGPTGLTCALLLARRGITSVVFDAQTEEQACRDRRLLALSRGSWQAVEPLLAQLPARAPIEDVFVSSAGEFGVTHIRARDFDGGALGATVFYGDLVGALSRAAAAQPRIVVRRPLRVQELLQSPASVQVVADGGGRVQAALAVHAEGWVAAAGRTQPSGGDATAQALVGDVHVAGPARASAYERFTRDGPLALLPHPSGPAPLASLVWCMPAEQAGRRAALSPQALMHELQQAIGRRVGRVESIGPLRAFPLHVRMRDDLRSHRCIAIGNAAQSLHPVAGQGFNLAVRDCATLAECLATSGGDVQTALARYAQRRRADRAAIGTLTRWLPPLFATRFAPVAVGRALGLTALGLVAPLRHQLAHLLMFGVRG